MTIGRLGPAEQWPGPLRACVPHSYLLRRRQLSHVRQQYQGHRSDPQREYHLHYIIYHEFKSNWEQ